MLSKERVENNSANFNVSNDLSAANNVGDNNGGLPSAIHQQQQVEYISKCINFLLQRITYLTSECNVQILLVLDGSTPPIKQTVVSGRRDKRRKAVEERDSEFLPQQQQQQNGEEVEAIATEKEAFSRISASKRAGSGIDPNLRSMLHSRLLNELRSHSIPFLIAPYEADGQLAYLSNSGMVDAIITEDSDLICLGVERIIYKLGGWNGASETNRSTPVLMGTLLCRKDLGSARGIDLMDFSDVMLVVMFVSAGCDYCNSLKGIGIVTARDIVARVFFSPDANVPVLKQVLHELYQLCHKEERAQLFPLEDEEKESARRSYEREFLGAVVMYRHPLVYDPFFGDVIANDVSREHSETSKRVFVSASFLRDEELLMEYEPYRKLVMDREAIYEIVGRPRAPHMTQKIAGGSVDRPTLVNNGSEEDPAELFDLPNGDALAGALETINVLHNTHEEEVDFNRLMQGTTSCLSSNSGLQPLSQEFSVAGRGTQQSKSSSDKTMSSLSPDLLASPSPVKHKIMMKN
jgi:5'-3' exonuclease